MGMKEREEMSSYFGDGWRLANLMQRNDITSMDALDRKEMELGPAAFELALTEMKNLGPVGVADIQAGLAQYRRDQENFGMAVDSNIKYDVWTRNTKPEWLTRNAGCSDMRLLSNVPVEQALALGERLRELYGDDNVELHPVNKSPKAGTVGQITDELKEREKNR